jgi:hypothetical protein
MVARPPNAHAALMVRTITPENELERRLLADPRLRAGLDWGAPRSGHPEGRVADHVAAILSAIPAADPLRSDLRLLALVHDSFKAAVRPHDPWSPDNDHATLARRFAERYTSDEGKDLTFLWWFRRELAIAGRLPRHRQPARDTDGEDVVYVKAFATEPHQQPAIAQAANELVAEQQARMRAEGEVLISDDGLRVWLVWRWRGSRRELIERDAHVVGEALAAHPIFADARAVEARIFRAASAA